MVYQMINTYGACEENIFFYSTRLLLTKICGKIKEAVIRLNLNIFLERTSILEY